MRELVLGALSENDRRTLLDGGTPSHERPTSSGPLCPALTFRRREVLVEEYPPAAWRSRAAWHTDWRERDYDVLG